MTAIEYMDMMRSTMTTAHATPPMCSAMVLISNGMGVLLESWVWHPPGRSRLGELEVYRDRHDDWNRHPVQQGRGVDPLFDRLDGGRVEQRNPPKHLHVGDLALGADRALEDDDALDAGLFGDVRVGRVHGLELLGLLDLSADPDGLHGGRGVG